MESAEARRARLKALREAAAGTDELNVPSTAPDEPQLKFRNYAVKDQKNIKHTTVDAAQAPEFVAPVVEPSVVQEVQGEVSSQIFGHSACRWLQNQGPIQPFYSYGRRSSCAWPVSLSYKV